MRYGSLKLEPGVAREAAQPGIRELQLSLRGTVYNGKVATLQFVFGAADTVLCSKRGKCQKDVARSLLNPLLCGLSLTNFHFAFFFLLSHMHTAAETLQARNAPRFATGNS